MLILCLLIYVAVFTPIQSSFLADTFTLENVVIDNYYFGVSAVALDGSETPVVFPGAAGSFGN